MWILAEPKALLLLLLPLALLAGALLWRRRHQAQWQLALCGPEVLRKRSRATKRIYRVIFGLILAGLGLICFVIARPTSIEVTTKKWAEGMDILIILDVSESMDATDFLPNRIEVAKSVIREFIQRRHYDRIGLIVFAGEAMTKSPLTTDTDFLLSQVDDVRLRELKQGTAVGTALANGVAKLRTSESKNKIIILFSDGDSNVGTINPMTATQLAAQDSIRIYTIGVGKQSRVVVPIYAHDALGRKTQVIAQVPSYLNPDLLKEISRKTRAKSFMATDPQALSRVLLEIDKLERTKIEIMPIERRHEHFLPFAIAAIVLIAISSIALDTRYRIVRIQRQEML